MQAAEAQGGVPPLVLPPPLSQLPWDLAQQEFGVAGTDFIGHLGRVLLAAAQDQKASQVVDSIGEPVRLPPPERRKTSTPGKSLIGKGFAADFPRTARKT